MAHDRLLEVAVREFGQKGLEGASTRGIAAAAGTAMSSITYHYGGKEGLYLAAADYIAQQMEGVAQFSDDASLPDMPEAAREALQTILGRLIDKLVSKQTTPWSMFIMREQMNPTEAFDRIYAGPMGRSMDLLVELVCIATGRRDVGVSRVAVVTLFGQVLAMRAARATCARLFERPVDSPELVAEVRARVAANTDAILDRLIAERQESL
jgi:AcrR family transcriptional regulator